MQKVLVVYESMFGNTHHVAEAVAAGLRSAVEVTLVDVGEAPLEIPGRHRSRRGRRPHPRVRDESALDPSISCRAGRRPAGHRTQRTPRVDRRGGRAPMDCRQRPSTPKLPNHICRAQPPSRPSASCGTAVSSSWFIRRASWSPGRPAISSTASSNAPAPGAKALSRLESGRPAGMPSSSSRPRTRRSISSRNTR